MTLKELVKYICAHTNPFNEITLRQVIDEVCAHPSPEPTPTPTSLPRIVDDMDTTKFIIDPNGMTPESINTWLNTYVMGSNGVQLLSFNHESGIGLFIMDGPTTDDHSFGENTLLGIFPTGEWVIYSQSGLSIGGVIVNAGWNIVSDEGATVTHPTEIIEFNVSYIDLIDTTGKFDVVNTKIFGAVAAEPQPEPIKLTPFAVDKYPLSFTINPNALSDSDLTAELARICDTKNEDSFALVAGNGGHDDPPAIIAAHLEDAYMLGFLISDLEQVIYCSKLIEVDEGIYYPQGWGHAVMSQVDDEYHINWTPITQTAEFNYQDQIETSRYITYYDHEFDYLNGLVCGITEEVGHKEKFYTGQELAGIWIDPTAMSYEDLRDFCSSREYQQGGSEFEILRANSGNVGWDLDAMGRDNDGDYFWWLAFNGNAISEIGCIMPIFMYYADESKIGYPDVHNGWVAMYITGDQESSYTVENFSEPLYIPFSDIVGVTSFKPDFATLNGTVLYAQPITSETPIHHITYNLEGCYFDETPPTEVLERAVPCILLSTDGMWSEKNMSVSIEGTAEYDDSQEGRVYLRNIRSDITVNITVSDK